MWLQDSGCRDDSGCWLRAVCTTCTTDSLVVRRCSPTRKRRWTSWSSSDRSRNATGLRCSHGPFFRTTTTWPYGLRQYLSRGRCSTFRADTAEGSTAVGVERWGQRAGRIGSLLDKHAVAVSRWVAHAARERADDPGLEEKMRDLDRQLSQWALAARAGGRLASRRPPT